MTNIVYTDNMIDHCYYYSVTNNVLYWYSNSILTRVRDQKVFNSDEFKKVAFRIIPIVTLIP